MGTIVHKNGAVDVILEHLDKAVTRSAAQGGGIAEMAAQTLGPVHSSCAQVEAELAEARKAEGVARGVLHAARAKATGVVALVHDMVWNAIGRPRSDPAFALLFPGGWSAYTDGSCEKQPRRMELLARLFEKKLHPKLSKERHFELAAEVRAAAGELAAALEAWELLAENVELLERTRTAMARAAQAALMNFKRVLKCTGHTEPEIHRIIPVQPRSYSKKWKADGKAANEVASGAADTASAAGAPGAEPKPA
jgi:hypothetical protein